MSRFTESDVEDVALEWLSGLGYAVLHGPDISPEGSTPERAAYSDVVLMGRLEQAVDRLNPHIPSETRRDALKKVAAAETPSLIEENRRLHRAVVEGIDVEFYAEDGAIRGDKVRLVDFGDPSANDWLAVNQFTVIENGNNRRPDVVVFVNGLPLAVIELKIPATKTRPWKAPATSCRPTKTRYPRFSAPTRCF